MRIHPLDTRIIQSRGPRLLIRPADLFSIEASFVLFLVSGRYKMLPEMRGFPVDVTALFFVTTTCLVVFAIVSGRCRVSFANPSVLLMVLFTEFTVVSLFWSSFQPLNTEKTLRFVVLASPAFLAAYLIAPDSDRRERFLRLLLWFSIGLVLYYFYYRFIKGIDITSVAADRGYIPGPGGEYLDNYLEYGDHAGILFIAFLTLAVFGSAKQLYAAAIGLGVALYALAIIGGRGALAFAVSAVPILVIGLLLRSHSSISRLARLLALFCMLAGIGGVAVLVMSESGSLPESKQFTTLNRYQLHLSGEDTSSLGHRKMGRDEAFRQWLRKPLFGWGIGEFYVENAALKYPHNLLLEVLMELGLVGAFILFSAIALAVIACLGIARDMSAGWTEAVLALLFLTQLGSHLTVQGYLPDERIFLAYMGLVIGSRVPPFRTQPRLPTIGIFRTPPTTFGPGR